MTGGYCLDILIEFTIFQNSSMYESTLYEKDHIGNDRLKLQIPSNKCYLFSILLSCTLPNTRILVDILHQHRVEILQDSVLIKHFRFVAWS